METKEQAVKALREIMRASLIVALTQSASRETRDAAWKSFTLSGMYLTKLDAL